MKISNESNFSFYLTAISRWFENLGLIAIAAMGVVTLIDVIGSKFFQRPLSGITELIGIIQVVAIAGGLAYSTIKGQHIRVEFLTELLSKKSKAALEAFSSLMGCALFAIAVWVIFQHGGTLLHGGTRTFVLHIPLFPFAIWMSFCCLPVFFVIFLELIRAVQRMVK